MGQYYRPILGDSFGLEGKVFDRSVDGEYTFAKLLEHSWWQNPFVNAFSEFLYKEPSRVAWVGDYADAPDDFNFPNCSAFYVPYYGKVLGDSVSTIGVTSMTAVGNGRGGGDFHEGNTGFENVGIWAWQLISIEDKPPKDFSKTDIRFIEMR